MRTEQTLTPGPPKTLRLTRTTRTGLDRGTPGEGEGEGEERATPIPGQRGPASGSEGVGTELGLRAELGGVL